MRSENTGKSTASPFVYFVSGTPVYPPNTIYESTHNALAAAGDKPLQQVLKDLAKAGSVGGTWTVLPEAWWYHFLLAYLNYFRNNFSEPETMEQSALKVLQLMARTPPEAAWDHVLAYIIADIDNLSGWTKSWIKQSAEERNVFKGDDGNYYYHDHCGILIQIIGAKPTAETHLDFITDQIIRNFGCLRQIFNVFSIFAIAWEFQRDSSLFPRSMKAVLVEPQFEDTSHRWQLMQFERTRSIRWRPVSNLCDPEWLAGVSGAGNGHP